jgi:hypothetical protein
MDSHDQLLLPFYLEQVSISHHRRDHGQLRLAVFFARRLHAEWDYIRHVLSFHLDDKSLALIGNASGQDAEGARDSSEAFSIRRLEGRRWQWWALLWSWGRDSAPVKQGKSLEMGGGRRCYARWGCVTGVIPRSARSQEAAIRR